MPGCFQRRTLFMASIPHIVKVTADEWLFHSHEAARQ